MTQIRKMDCLRSALEGVALLHNSSESRLILGGRDGLDLLHRLSTNDLLSKPLTALTATTLTNEKGRIIDALRVVRYGSGHLLLGSADAEEEVLRWIEKYTIADDVAVRSITAETAMFALIGPRSLEAAKSLPSASEIGNGSWSTSVSGVTCFVFPDVTSLLHRVYFLVPVSQGPAFQEIIARLGVCALGHEEWNILRTLFGIPSMPGEVSLRFTPYDVGLEHTISTTKGCYIGQEVLARLDTYHKTRRTMIGIDCAADNPPGAGDVVYQNENEVGVVTSIAATGVNGHAYGLAVVRKEAASGGTDLNTKDGAKFIASSFPIALPEGGAIQQ